MTQDQFTEASTNEENVSHGATFKKSGDASSFTQISSEFQITKNSQETEKENNINFTNMRKGRLGDNERR